MKTEALVEQLLDLKIVVNLSRWKTKLDTIGTERNYYLSLTGLSSSVSSQLHQHPGP